MNILGVVVEYNPFHHGHAFHLEASKEKTKADLTVAVMSGSFLQRGEPAVLSSYERAAVAARMGVDLVFELPYAFAVQSADRFAEGAVKLLKAAGATAVCFGSEQGSIDPFLYQADLEKTHQAQLHTLLHKNLGAGMSFPSAYAKAAASLSPDHSLDVKQPNNILGLHYVKAAQRLQLEAATIQRRAAGYHDIEPSDARIASATSIRNMLTSKRIGEAQAYMPDDSAASVTEQLQQTGVLPIWETYYSLLQYRILTASPEDLAATAECREGIEHRLKAAVFEPDFASFIKHVKTKRYTRTSLQRLCTHILTNTSKTEIKDTFENEPPLHLLAATERGRKHLRTLRQRDIHPTVKGSSQWKTDPLSASAYDVHQLAFPTHSRSSAFKQFARMV
ncbi:nucleotidyltransferase [Alkalicoccus luteus]|uniref:nucleotidyltransferase n=1 Tax=Alkalicoccus luteus TaxID=1237094 RepID=UPI0040335FDD